MKKEIIILSDLWGIKKSEWLIHFKQLLSGEYNIKFYDSCELGGINLIKYEQENIHQQFVDFGIQKAIARLLTLEKKPKIYIGCSVGGVIAWKAGLLGLPIEKLITISATRLRKEQEKPPCPVQMYFGELDKYKPDSAWLKKMNCDYEIIKNGDHDIYKDEGLIAKMILILGDSRKI